ncbi:putative quinol monooxygenase [uncultured Friedmanniella sp.]|uniref:putative quinol monooxygenase n=1 Tax=uncultured Friedmanniella sp. TaxID=335381 RepID=UPI0035CA7680
MTTPTDSRPDPLTVVAFMRARPGREDELRSAFEALVEPTTQEAGYVNYDLHESTSDPGLFYFYENWESGDALDAHLDAPHLRQFVARIPELLDDDGLNIQRLRRI